MIDLTQVFDVANPAKTVTVPFNRKFSATLTKDGQPYEVVIEGRGEVKMCERASQRSLVAK